MSSLLCRELVLGLCACLFRGGTVCLFILTDGTGSTFFGFALHSLGGLAVPSALFFELGVQRLNLGDGIAITPLTVRVLDRILIL